ncbi:MAG: hypothetical protein JST40_09915 [Armatimonadetes bacterium]|nr:hypothetical protein [Armatimonadota bacterium]
MPKPSRPEFFYRYLQNRERRYRLPVGLGFKAGAWIVRALVGLGLFLELEALGPMGAALVAGLVAIPVLGVVTNLIGKYFSRSKTPEEEFHERADAAVKSFAELRDKGQMKRSVDPVALSLLEAAAYYWDRVSAVLQGPAWNEDSMTEGQNALREEMQSAANAAMDEVVLYCVSCIGQPSGSQKQDFKDLMNDLISLDVNSVLDRLPSIVSGEDPRYGYHSPNIQSVYTPCRELAEKLKLLAEQVEQHSAQQMRRMQEMSQSQGSVKIDSILNSLSSQQIAERELDQELRE